MSFCYRNNRSLVGVLLFGVAALVLATPASAQMGARVVQRNLAELATQAQVIVRGQVVDVKVEPHPDLSNLSTVLVTLRVQEVLKGTAGETFTFRQYIMNPLDTESRLGYRTGESLVLLMTGPSRLGLSSPVALEQGRFIVTSDSSGTLRVTNGRQNAGLFRNIRTAAPNLDSKVSLTTRKLLDQQPSGPIPYDQFKELVRGILAQ